MRMTKIAIFSQPHNKNGRPKKSFEPSTFVMRLNKKSCFWRATPEKAEPTLLAREENACILSLAAKRKSYFVG